MSYLWLYYTGSIVFLQKTSTIDCWVGSTGSLIDGVGVRMRDHCLNSNKWIPVAIWLHCGESYCYRIERCKYNTEVWLPLSLLTGSEEDSLGWAITMGRFYGIHPLSNHWGSTILLLQILKANHLNVFKADIPCLDLYQVCSNLVNKPLSYQEHFK